MLSSLASYLFGSAPEEEQAPDNESPSSSATSAAAATAATAATGTDAPPLDSQPLKTRQTENEWILVEKSRPFTRPSPRSRSRSRKGEEPLMECSLGPLFKSSCELTNNLGAKRGSTSSSGGDILDSSLCMSQGLGYHTDPTGFLGDILHDHHSDTAESDISSVPERVVHPSMEESWLVTPPACFTAGSKRMETSSMENLLIEHPSMSVYSHRGRPSSTGMDSDESSSEADAMPQDPNPQRRRTLAGLARHEPPRRPNALAARVGLAQAEAVKSMQRSYQRRLYKNLSNNRMMRSNLVREVKSQGNNRKLRSQRVQQPARRCHSNKQY